jgi:hypothetical protein
MSYAIKKDATQEIKSCHSAASVMEKRRRFFEYGRERNSARYACVDVCESESPFLFDPRLAIKATQPAGLALAVSIVATILNVYAQALVPDKGQIPVIRSDDPAYPDQILPDASSLPAHRKRPDPPIAPA